ncbi:hypothetical protein RhiirA4_428283 [Rhizophagus irregularis]|uniref:Uncharacterized protein n=1 Tax=Rhizophagus irregularis TaxID=588596 RepID=A0A2I1HCA4_9GLOM|nr:hypothetical protein RhiirA4_428283 [Rhizophagus irregularis]
MAHSRKILPTVAQPSQQCRCGVAGSVLHDYVACASTRHTYEGPLKLSHGSTLSQLGAMDSSHQEESNGSNFIKFGAILAKLSRFETLVLIFNKLSQASSLAPSQAITATWFGLAWLSLKAHELAQLM